MKQILAIFWKDARRFWPEIAVVLGLLVVLVLVYPATWRSDSGLEAFAGRVGPFAIGAKGFLAGCLMALIPVSWLVLIARVVHCERLVGDTQFWLTRPYEWWKLLAAKALYLAAFLYLPFVVAQMALLAEAGFRPFDYAAGLLYNSFLLTVILVLPVAALSTLTSGFGRLMLVLLGVILFIVIVAGVGSVLPTDVISGVPDMVSGTIALVAVAAGCAAAVVLLYAQRRARAGWMLLAATAVVLCATAFFDPDPRMIEKFYPQESAGQTPPVTFADGAVALNQARANETRQKTQVEITVPMWATGVQEGSAVIPQALKATLEGAGGMRWESPWQGVGMAELLPGKWGTTASFLIPRRIYEQMKGAPARLRIEIALVKAQRARETTIALPLEDFAVPDGTICSAIPWWQRPMEIRAIECRSAMRQPQLTYVTAQWTGEPCNATAPSELPRTGSAWIGELEPGPADLGITSVWSTPVNLSPPWYRYERGETPKPWNICPGTPVTFSEYRPEQQLRVEMTVEGFKLPEIAKAGVVILRSEP